MAQSVLHWGPVTALSIIVFLFFNTLYVSPFALWGSTHGKFLFVLWATMVVVLLWSYLNAIYRGPGAVPPGWEPADPSNKNKLQYCKTCKGYKAPRAHHCHSCGVCAKKMDHHCPWINSCVGHANQHYFLAFVTAVPIGCMVSFYACLVTSMYWFEFLQAYGYRRNSMRMFLSVVFSVGVSLGVSIGVGVLAYFQYRNILTNMTEIESWIVTKAQRRRREEPFVFPYGLGWRRNINEFLRRISHDGTDWTVVEGCSLYTLSMEQLAQKQAKRQQTVSATAKRSNGRCFGATHGWRTCYRAPFLDTIIQVKDGDRLQFWAEKPSWYYGEKVELVDGRDEPVQPRQRGWFPMACIDWDQPNAGADKPKAD
eukprot:m.490306 g.490306  ORF g.490306 m.490306 type:complete len:368 (+) comp27808_c0_seq1:218-1321(+)